MATSGHRTASNPGVTNAAEEAENKQRRLKRSNGLHSPSQSRM